MSWKKKTITRRKRIQVPDTVRFEANVSGKEEQTNLSKYVQQHTDKFRERER